MRRFALAAAIIAASISAQSSAQNVITLEEALERAGVGDVDDRPRSSNPRVYGPQSEEEAARAAIDQARLRPNPELSFEAENFAGSGAFSGLRSTEYTLGIGQQIELGGKRRARVESAERAARLAEISSDLARADLALAVRERFIKAVAAAQRLELATQIVERNRELARIANVLVEVGREPPLRAMRAEAALAEAVAELETARADDLAARQALAALWVSDEPAPQVGLTFPSLMPLISPGEEPALQLRLADARSDLAAAEIVRERSLGVPDITVSAGVRRFEERGDNAFIVGFSIPLPFGNRNQGSIAAAEARSRGAQADAAINERDFRLEEARTRSQFLAADRRAETLRAASLPQADEALRLVEIGYRNGRFPLIEVLAASEARDAIRENLIQAEEQRDLLAARLIWLTTK